MNEREVKAEVWIPLTQGKVAVIDFEDFEKVRGLSYYAHRDGRTFYAHRHVTVEGKRKLVGLHQDLMQSGAGLEVDHRDGDGLNNRRRTNLRIATRLQNSLNQKLQLKKTSQFRGVSRNGSCVARPWHAKISLDYKSTSLGYFEKESDAARAYDAAAREHFGEWAKPNFTKL